MGLGIVVAVSGLWVGVNIGRKLAAAGARTQRVTSWLLTSTILCSASIFIPSLVHAQQAGIPTSTQRVVSFSIPAQPLPAAIDAFIRATGWQVGYSSRAADGITSKPVVGSMPPAQALQTLLAGTGMNVRLTGPTTAALVAQGATANGTLPDGAIQLDTVDVSGGRVAAADAPYQTPGSVAHISRQEMDRVPPISTGDVFRTTPGVISAGGRSGISINPNIRGLQGMGRVNTTVDGARQTTSSYRGYSGSRDEVYVDPDMIGGIDISKGPSEGVGTGAIAGNINFRTLEAKDFIKDGNNYGLRLKGSLGGNTVTPRAPDRLLTSTPNQIVKDRSSGFHGDMYSGSFAMAALKENYEFIVAYSKREQGNYFVGTKVPDGIKFWTGNFTWDSNNANARVPAGSEAFNTSENTESFLSKGKVKWGDGQSLELGYLYFGSKYGEITEFNIAPNGLFALNYGQTPLLESRVDTYTAKYRHKPSDNPFVNFRANLWHSDVGRNTYGMRTSGGDIGNVSTFSTPFGELSWDNGAEVVRENAQADQYPTSITGAGGWMTLGPTGERILNGAFSKATLKPVDWLTLSAGGRYDSYESKGSGYLVKYPEKSGSRASPNAEVVLTPFEGLQFYGQYKEGYRPPSLRESHWHYEGLLINNPNLQPEVSKNKEVGINFLRANVLTPGDKVRAKLSSFDNHYDDYIFRGLRSTRGGNVYHWFNMDAANYRGYEISGGYDAGVAFIEGAYTKYRKIEYCPTLTTCVPPSGLRTNIGAPLQVPQQADYSTNYIPPDWSGSLTAGVRLFDQKLTIGGRTHFATSRYGSTWRGGPGQIGYTMAPPGYRVFDVFGSYKFNEDNVLNFSIENITDQYYFGPMTSLGMPSPGRTARLSYTATLNDTKPLFPEIRAGNASRGAPGSDWTGLYVGGHLGYGLGDIKGVTTTAAGVTGGVAATESADVDLQGLTKGFQAGFNYQFANGFVLGIEAERIWLKHQKTQKTLATEVPALAMRGWYQATTQYELDWMTTLRGRAGFAFDRLFVYGTGGVAWLKEIEERTQYRVDSAASTALIPGEFGEQAAKTRVGWTAGGGFEYALTNNWSLKGEYAFAHFGEEEFLFPRARAGVRSPGSSQITNGRQALNELALQTMKMGLNYRF